MTITEEAMTDIPPEFWHVYKRFRENGVTRQKSKFIAVNDLFIEPQEADVISLASLRKIAKEPREFHRLMFNMKAKKFSDEGIKELCLAHPTNSGYQQERLLLLVRECSVPEDMLLEAIRTKDINYYYSFLRHSIPVQIADELLSRKIDSDQYAFLVRNGLNHIKALKYITEHTGYPFTSEIINTNCSLDEYEELKLQKINAGRYAWFRKKGLAHGSAMLAICDKSRKVPDSDYVEAIQYGLGHEKILELHAEHDIDFRFYLPVHDIGITEEEYIEMARRTDQVVIWNIFFSFANSKKEDSATLEDLKHSLLNA